MLSGPHSETGSGNSTKPHSCVPFVPKGDQDALGLLIISLLICVLRSMYSSASCCCTCPTLGQGSNFHLWFLHVEKATPVIFKYVTLVWRLIQPIFTKPAATCCYSSLKHRCKVGDVTVI